MLGNVTVAGKKAMKLGDCQCVSPGMILLAMSGVMLSQGSGSEGACVGRRGAR